MACDKLCGFKRNGWHDTACPESDDSKKTYASKFDNKNDERADRASHALESLSDGVTDESITDLLTNLRHLCDREGYDFDAIFNAAEMHYEEEA